MRVKQEKEYWDQAAQDPEVDEKYICDVPLKDCLMTLLPFGKPSKILDLGCGVGRLAIPMALMNPQATVYGLDTSEEMLFIAEIRSRQLQNIQYLLGDGRLIPDQAVDLDYAYTMLVFQHLPEEAVRGYIRQVYGRLVPGGVFAFQIVVRGDVGPFSKPVSTDDAVKWCTEEGFHVFHVNYGWIHRDWVLIKVTKPL